MKISRRSFVGRKRSMAQIIVLARHTDTHIPASLFNRDIERSADVAVGIFLFLKTRYARFLLGVLGHVLQVIYNQVVS